MPESERWEESRAQGGTLHWATRDLLGVLGGGLAALAIVGAWMPGGLVVRLGSPFAGVAATLVGLGLALVGFLRPVRGYLARALAVGAISETSRRTTLRNMLLAACLAGVSLMGSWGSIQWVVKWAIALDRSAVAAGAAPAWHVKETTQIVMGVGAIVGSILVALAAGRFGRRIVYAALCLASIASIAWLYLGSTTYGGTFLAAATLASLTTAGFYGWYPLVLPELFPTALRTTALGFAYNFGRVLAAIGSLQTAPRSFGSFPKKKAARCLSDANRCGDFPPQLHRPPAASTTAGSMTTAAPRSSLGSSSLDSVIPERPSRSRNFSLRWCPATSSAWASTTSSTPPRAMPSRRRTPCCS